MAFVPRIGLWLVAQIRAYALIRTTTLITSAAGTRAM
jgi:hypothetical protein